MRQLHLAEVDAVRVDFYIDTHWLPILVYCSSSHKLLPPEGKAGGRRRESKNLEPSNEVSELCSWNRSKTHFLHWKTTRIRRFCHGGWNKPRVFSERRDSWSNGKSRDDRFQSVHRNRISLIPYLESKKFLQPLENSVRTSVQRG